MHTDKLIIAGPCAAEHDEQIETSIRESKSRNVDFIRMPLWKPRTKPGFEGVGDYGIKFLIEAAKSGINPATEVLTPEQAKFVTDSVLSAVPEAKILIWIGSRNQNHFIQREIAEVAAKDERILLMAKNQMWHSKDHWTGILAHILSSSIPQERVLLCHRGFTPHSDESYEYRNVPDFALAMEVKKETGVKMLLDPSHIGGTVENVKKVMQEAAQYDFDGYMIEVHPDPTHAKTDADQQLTWTEFDSLKF